MSTRVGSILRGRRLSGLIYVGLVVLTIIPAISVLVGADGWSGSTKTLAVLISIGTGAALIQSASNRSFSLAWSVFWLWSYVFLGLAPMYQLGTHTFPWLGKFPDSTVVAALAIVLLGCATTYVIGVFTAHAKSNHELRSITHRITSVWPARIGMFINVVLGVYIAIAIAFVVLIGPALFSGKTALQHQLVLNGSVPGAGSLFFISTAGAIVLPAAAIICRKNGAKVWWQLIVVAAIAALVVTNPLAGSRFLTGSFLIAMAGALLVRTSILRYMPAGIGVVLVALFPTLDRARGDGTGAAEIAVALPQQSLVTFDFDSFEMLLRELSVSGQLDGASPGRWELFVAPFLRWIPGLSDSVHGHISGSAVAKLTSMSYTNVSMPLWGEAHLTGGIAGVVLAFALCGLLLGLIRQPAVHTGILNARPTRLVVDSSVAALLFIVLRGSLYEVLGYLLFAITFAVILWAFFALAAGQEPPSTIDPTQRPRTIAFYLPQFHTFAENDEWWGEGFTDWVNVRRAEPAFQDHDHPRKAGELEEYDLSDVTVMHRQADLAREHDVDAFCFYYYWFAGKRLLEKPLDQYLDSGPDFPFCISWANENWSRRWDGKDKESLIRQDYTADFAAEVFKDFLPYLRDPRYLRVDGAAVLLVHRADHLPDGIDYGQIWRNLAAASGVGPIHIVAAETHPGVEPAHFGFDAVAEFPPVGSNTLAAAQLLPPRGLSPRFRGRLMSYKRLAKRFMARPATEFPRYRGVVPGWDNTARRQEAATIYVGDSPFEYQKWLTHARTFESRARGKNGLVFVNAWN